MNRREMLTGAAAMLAAVTTGRALAADHAHMDHGQMDMQHAHSPNKHQALLSATADCVVKAQLCVQHCLVLLGQGDQEMAACAQSASQVIAACGAMQQLAAADSRHLPQMAKLAMDLCKECEDECRKMDKHPECKACGEACISCYRECKKIAA